MEHLLKGKAQNNSPPHKGSCSVYKVNNMLTIKRFVQGGQLYLDFPFKETSLAQHEQSSKPTVTTVFLNRKSFITLDPP
jgi:hypothetical protein